MLTTMNPEADPNIRPLSVDDYPYVIARVNDWWGGRNVMDMLPYLFFKHFCDSSLVYLDQGRVVGFVVGFVSNTDPELAYIHFTGVDPAYRHRAIASSLYAVFIAQAQARGCQRVQCVTSPSNAVSLAYHQRMGFRASEYDSNGDPVGIADYDGPGNDRVLLTLTISPASTPGAGESGLAG